MPNEIYDYELLGYRFSFYRTFNNLYRLGSLTNLDIVGCAPEEIETRIKRYKIVLSFIEEQLKILNGLDTF